MHPLTLKCKTQYDSCEAVTAVSLTCHSLLTSMLLIISGLMNSSQSRLLYWVRYAKKKCLCFSLSSFKCLLPLKKCMKNAVSSRVSNP